MGRAKALIVLAMIALAASAGAAAPAKGSCNRECLEMIGNQYRAAYVAHDPKLAPFAARVRYTENNVEMPFPDGTWSTVTEEVGPALTLSDPTLGSVAIFTAIRQRAVPGFLAIRLKVSDRRITQVEQIISTKRNLSSPPTPIGEVEGYAWDPVIDRISAPSQRLSRAQLTRHANGYFDTLQHNNGEIRGTCFHADASRRENGMLFRILAVAFAPAAMRSTIGSGARSCWSTRRGKWQWRGGSSTTKACLTTID